MKMYEAPMESEHWSRTADGFLLGEDDRGYLWLPTWRLSSDARFDGGERRWGRAFQPWNPLHWSRWLNTRRRRALVWLEPC